MTKINGVSIIHEDDLELIVSKSTKNEIKAQIGMYTIWWYEYDLTIYANGADVLYIRNVFWNDRLSEISLVGQHVMYGNYKYSLAQKV